MQPAQRLAATFSGQLPDRVPVVPKIWVDLAAALTGTDLRTVIEDHRLATRLITDAAISLGVDGSRALLFPERKIAEQDGRLCEVDQHGRRIGEIDIDGGLSTRLERIEDFHLEDPCHIAFFNFRTHAKPYLNNIADVARIAVPDKTLYEQMGYGDLLRSMQNDTAGRIVMIGNCVSPTLAFSVYFRGMEQGLIDLIDDPQFVHAIMDKGEAFAIERGKFKIDVGLRILRLNDSVANMSVISPAQWKQFIFPHLKVVCDELHRYCPQIKIYSHICGNTLPILDLLVETGLDCIGPLDPLGGFTVAQAREKVGNDMVLMGGVDTQSFVNSQPEAVRAEALRCIEDGAVQGSRYILGSGCVIPRNARRENLEALVDAANRAA